MDSEETFNNWKFRQNLPRFVEYQRAYVKAALEKKHICGNCETEDCHQFCSMCNKSVAYCSKNCQVSHWRKHRIICKAFRHVVKESSKIAQENLREFFMCYPSEVLSVLLTSAGIESGLAICMAVRNQDPAPRRRMPFQAVIADGRLYDIRSVIYPWSREYCDWLPRKIEPLPPFTDEIYTNLGMKIIITTLHSDAISVPFCCPRNFLRRFFGDDDIEIIIKAASIGVMRQHYLLFEGDQNVILRLYGDKIPQTTGKTVEEFTHELHALRRRHRTLQEAANELGQENNNYLCNLPYSGQGVASKFIQTGGMLVNYSSESSLFF